MHEFGGCAQAMAVTGSRLAAVKYKLAFGRLLDCMISVFSPTVSRTCSQSPRVIEFQLSQRHSAQKSYFLEIV